MGRLRSLPTAFIARRVQAKRTRTTYDTATAVYLPTGVRSIDVRRASGGAYVAGGEQLLQSHSPIEGEWAR